MKYIKRKNITLLIDNGTEIRLNCCEDVYEGILDNICKGVIDRDYFCLLVTADEISKTNTFVNNKRVGYIEHIDGSRIIGFTV